MLTCSLEVNRGIIARGGFRFSTVFMTGDAELSLVLEVLSFHRRGICPRSTDIDWRT